MNHVNGTASSRSLGLSSWYLGPPWAFVPLASPFPLYCHSLFSPSRSFLVFLFFISGALALFINLFLLIPFQGVCCGFGFSYRSVRFLDRISRLWLQKSSFLACWFFSNSPPCVEDFHYQVSIYCARLLFGLAVLSVLHYLQQLFFNVSVACVFLTALFLCVLLTPSPLSWDGFPILFRLSIGLWSITFIQSPVVVVIFWVYRFWYSYIRCTSPAGTVNRRLFRSTNVPLIQSRPFNQCLAFAVICFVPERMTGTQVANADCPTFCNTVDGNQYLFGFILRSL